MAARAEDTGLSGAAIEPEIMDLIKVLQKMGGDYLEGATTRVIRIEGVDRPVGLPPRLVTASRRRRGRRPFATAATCTSAR